MHSVFIKAPMSEKAKEWLSKMRREGKFWFDELKNFKGDNNGK